MSIEDLNISKIDRYLTQTLDSFRCVKPEYQMTKYQATLSELIGVRSFVGACFGSDHWAYNVVNNAVAEVLERGPWS